MLKEITVGGTQSVYKYATGAIAVFDLQERN